MNLPLNIDLNGKVAVVTGGGGVLCSSFAKAIAASGAKVAVLDLNEEAAKKSCGRDRGRGRRGYGHRYQCVGKIKP